MTVSTLQSQDVLIHIHDLVDPNVELDLTADRWNLKDGQASVIVGRDVIRPDSFGPDGGRKPIGSSIPTSDRPLTWAHGLEFFGRKVSRFSDVFVIGRYQSPSLTSLQKLSDPTEWPAAMVGGFITANEDERFRKSPGSRRITSISTTDNTNDTLNWIGDITIGISGDKFNILFADTHDKRGIWISNGRRLWLIHGGVAVKYLDLGSGLEGQTWDLARIGRNLVMFVNERYAARIIHLDEEPSGALSDNSTLAGLIAPIKPRDVEQQGILTNHSWLMKQLNHVDGFITVGTCRIKVRAVNLIDGSESKFVQVYKEGGTATDDFLTINDNAAVTVWNEMNNTDIAPPPLHERWTHIEIWRTTSTGVDYYREKTVEIARFANERSNAPTLTFTGAAYNGLLNPDASLRGTIVKTGAFSSYTFQSGDYVSLTGDLSNDDFVLKDYNIREKINNDSIRIVVQTEGIMLFNVPTGLVSGHIHEIRDILNVDTLISEQYNECTLSDGDLAGGPVLTADDIVAGGPPPICKKVASVGGVTICMGKAEDAINPTADSRNFYATDYSALSVLVSSRPILIIKEGFFVNYERQPSDRFSITALHGGPGPALGEYKIIASTDRSLVVEGPFGDFPSGLQIEGHIRRPYEIEWPTIKSDEDVWYSRTDVFSPESFPVRALQISSIGDTFRNMVNVGNYVAVIMDSGVHLLFRVGTQLVKDTIAAVGQGTPWPLSVVTVSNTVLWGSSEGPKRMTVSTEVASTGMRASIGMLGETAIRQWFRDAFDAGEEIDAGVDEVNHCVRWRRKLTDGTSQACQYSYRTGRWTLLDDDNGVGYGATAFAESDARSSQLLYSVSESGAAFEVNHQELSHPYDGKTVQAILDDSYLTTTQAIRRIGAFTPLMLGDVIRFRSTSSSARGLRLNKEARVIRAASDNQISFSGVRDLRRDDEFIIGANRFRYRPAPLQGKQRTTIKTLDGLTLRALPGPRNSPGGPWPDPPEGKFTLRAYREYHDDPIDERDREIEVFDEDDKSRTTDDRISALQANGSSLEVEVEMIESRTDFRLELLQVEVREEGDQLADTSETE